MKKLMMILMSVLILTSTIFGGSFSDKNVSFRQANLGPNDHVVRTKCIGEITNESGASHYMVFFDVNIYDSNEKLLDTSIFYIKNFRKETTRSFKLYFRDINKQNIKYYSIVMTDIYIN